MGATGVSRGTDHGQEDLAAAGDLHKVHVVVGWARNEVCEFLVAGNEDYG